MARRDGIFVQSFLGRDALAIDSVRLNNGLDGDTLHGMTGDNVHPRSNRPPSEDPTLRAVLLGTYEGKIQVIF